VSVEAVLVKNHSVSRSWDWGK